MTLSRHAFSILFMCATLGSSIWTNGTGRQFPGSVATTKHGPHTVQVLSHQPSGNSFEEDSYSDERDSTLVYFDDTGVGVTEEPIGASTQFTNDIYVDYESTSASLGNKPNTAPNVILIIADDLVSICLSMRKNSPDWQIAFISGYINS